jgi:hypothetical protein
VSGDGLATRAEQLARSLLSDELPMRWLHTQRVAATAAVFAADLPQADIVVTSAWLHDIGYASGLIDAGFHPLDGARYLRGEGWPAEIQNLVAHHSCADAEAAARGVATELLAEFPDEPSAARDAVWAADATTGPAGQRFSVAERADEVVARYGADHLVSVCIRRIEPELQFAFDRTMLRLGRIR